MPLRHKPTIPVHSLDELSQVGVEIHAIADDYLNKALTLLGVHRDDHYNFILLENGSGSIMIDFKLHTITGPALCFILPGQVHHPISSNKARGWFMAVDPLLVDTTFQSVLNGEGAFVPIPLAVSELESFSGILPSLYRHYRENTNAAYYRPVLHSLVASVVGMVLNVYTERTCKDEQALRGAAITSQFRQLLTAHFRTVKSPVAYAQKMNRSLSYLNEMVKAYTGSPVSYWIQHEIMMEARRLLYYSRLSVKEIAYQLGYDDPTYFSRLFKKVVTLTPGEFRKRYRE